jgi:hypothetical protein
MNASTIRSVNLIVTTFFRDSEEGDHRERDCCWVWWILADLLAKKVSGTKDEATQIESTEKTQGEGGFLHP